jgi:Holliday junction resolvasome RuvABC endonuclease subunit
MTGPKVIGLDLSLTCSGIAGIGWTDTIRPGAKLRGHERLQWIQERVGDFVRTSDLVIVEGPSYGNQGQQRQSGHHERAGLWWLITQTLWTIKTPFAVVTPAGRAKYATGRGNAAKADVVREVTRRFDWFDGGEDEADALILAAMGADHLGHPMVVMPKLHRDALDAVAWPEAVMAA